MSGLYGPDAWPGYFDDPIAFYLARRVRRGQAMAWLDDPIRGMYVSLAEWAGERRPEGKKARSKSRGGKRAKERYRRWRLAGLLATDRALTDEETFELGRLLVAVREDRRRAALRRRRKATTAALRTIDTRSRT